MSTSILRAGSAGINPLPYAAIPNALLADRRLTATDVRLAGLLLTYARNKPECWPAVATLAGQLGRCRRTVQLSLRRLKESGWIAERPAGNPTGRVIVLAWRCTQSQGATGAARGAQPAYTQGLPRPTHAVAPEGISPKEKVVARGREKPLAPAELPDLYASWLALPEGSPLRQLALRRIAMRC